MAIVQPPPLRTVHYVIAAKWCLAIALLFALTLPLTTCQSRGKLQEHHVTFALDDPGLMICFVWPLFVLVPRTFWRAMRLAYPVPIAECLCAVFALIGLWIQIAGLALISIGGISPGSGYELASSTLLGYIGLFANRRRLAATGAASDRGP